MGASIWYATLDGIEQGPLPVVLLKELVVAGRIEADTPIRREGMDAPVPASRVKGLLPITSAATDAPPDGVPSAATASTAVMASTAAEARPRPRPAPPGTDRRRHGLRSPGPSSARVAGRGARSDPQNPFAAPASAPEPVVAAGARGAVAGIGRRFGAMLIDGVLNLALMVGVVAGVAMATFGPQGPNLPALIVVYLILAVGCPYWVLCEGIWSTTPGKAMLRMRVVDRRGRRIGFGISLGRNLMRGLLLWVVPLGGILDAIFGLIDEHHRSLHDRVAGTRVIHLDAPTPRRRRTASARRPARNR